MTQWRYTMRSIPEHSLEAEPERSLEAEPERSLREGTARMSPRWQPKHYSSGAGSESSSASALERVLLTATLRVGLRNAQTLSQLPDAYWKQ